MGKNSNGKAMSKRETVEMETEKLLNPILDEYQFELVDVEYVKEAGNFFLRAFIDKPGGITVDDCEVVSRRMSDLLDEKDFIEESYIFEVSSPGLGRPLKKPKDFERSLGELVEIRTFKPIDRQKVFEGILLSYSEEDVTIVLESGFEAASEEDAEEKPLNPDDFDEESKMTIPRSAIALIRLALDF